MNIQDKLAIIRETFKPHKVSDSFMVLKDYDGWTDAYIAYLKQDNKSETARLEADKRNAKGKMIRYIVDKEQAPKINSLINLSNEWIEIDDIETTIKPNGIMIELVVTKKEDQEGTRVLVDPRYLTYFLDTEVVLKVKNDTSPVQVFEHDELIGLIMPVRRAL